MNEVAKSTNCRMETERLDCGEGTNKGSTWEAELSLIQFLLHLPPGYEKLVWVNKGDTASNR